MVRRQCMTFLGPRNSISKKVISNYHIILDDPSCFLLVPKVGHKILLLRHTFFEYLVQASKKIIIPRNCIIILWIHAIYFVPKSRQIILTLLIGVSVIMPVYKQLIIHESAISYTANCCKFKKKYIFEGYYQTFQHLKKNMIITCNENAVKFITCARMSNLLQYSI